MAAGSFFVNTNPLQGDLNGNGSVGLEDAIMALRLSSGMNVDLACDSVCDMNGDGRIGMAEALYILQKVSGTR